METLILILGVIMLIYIYFDWKALTDVQEPRLDKRTQSTVQHSPDVTRNNKEKDHKHIGENKLDKRIQFTARYYRIRNKEGFKQVTDKKCCAYLDIETTSLNPNDGDITVIGLCLDDGNEYSIIQLVENEICPQKLIEIVNRVEVLYTYNGSRFDLPYIKAKLGLDLTRYCIHNDLMYECWRRNLYGGFKKVEKRLGIKRNLTGIDGKVAVDLWRRYKFYGDCEALTTLLEYNKEDVLNLIVLRRKLIKRSN